MLKIREAIVVEGRYDKNTLSQVVDTVILETAGFGIFRDEETLALLRRIGAKRGLILLTDSDGAGFLIRNYLKGALPQDQVKHAYIPDRYGQRGASAAPARRGNWGWRGCPLPSWRPPLRQARCHRPGGGQCPPQAPPPHQGRPLRLRPVRGEGSREKRQKLLRKLDLPAHLSPNAMLPILSALYDRNALLEEMRNL